MRRTFIYDKRARKVVPKPVYERAQVAPDLKFELGKPFVSPVDGSYIDTHAKWREHNRRNGVIDVGDDPAATRRQAVARPDEASIVEDIKASIHNAHDERGRPNHDWKF